MSEQRVTVTLDNVTPKGTPPTLPERPRLIKRLPTRSAGPTPGAPAGEGRPSVTYSPTRRDWIHRDAPPHVPGLTYAYTEYENGTMQLSLLEMHAPNVEGAAVSVTDTFTGTAGGEVSFALPADILNVGATGTVTIAHEATYDAKHCSRITVTQPVTFARHYYREGGAAPDVVVTLLDHVQGSGRTTETEEITDCPCRTKATPQGAASQTYTVDPGSNVTTTVTHTGELALEISVGFSFDLPFAEDSGLTLKATGGMERSTALKVTLPGGHTYHQYDQGRVTYWETT